MSGIPDGNYWYAEPDGDFPTPKWCPILQTNNSCHTLQVWFRTPGECEEFIRDHILGAQAQFEHLSEAAPVWPPEGFVDLGHLEPGTTITLPPDASGAVWSE
jgi:hypothetical protein